MKEENIYENVPGQGKPLGDGTWWTNCHASVGEVCITPYYHRKVKDGRYWASDNRSECVERGFFDGKSFCRWKQLPQTDYKPCILYENNSLKCAVNPYTRCESCGDFEPSTESILAKAQEAPYLPSIKRTHLEVDDLMWDEYINL